MNINAILERLLPQPVQVPCLKLLDADHCHPEETAGKIIDRNAMYFQIWLNQMRLASNVEWFSVYDPLVVVTVGFSNGDGPVEIPVILGPGAIAQQMAAGAPRFGTVLRNLEVTAPHPYRGGGLTISISFYKVRRKSYTRSIIKMIEQLSSMVGMAHAGSIAAASGAILEGLEGLLGGGDTVSLGATRFNTPIVPYPLKSSFFAMLMPPAPTNLDQLAVYDGCLFETTAQNDRQEFVSSDFVLLSIAGMPRREDRTQFPPFALKQQAMIAVREGEPSRKRAKALLLSALQQLRASADFTSLETDLLFKEWLAEFNAGAAEFDSLHNLGGHGEERALTGVSNELNQAIKELDL